MPSERPRTYGQREPVAAALDVVGDRWTLLIARELLLGPRRWTDLLANLDGIGKNLLARRLRDLEDAGLVTADVLPWASSRTKLYRLTERAAPLERAVLELARLGVGFLPAAGEMRADWAALTLAITLDVALDAAPGDQVVHASIDGAWFTIRLDVDGLPRVRRGREGDASTVLHESAVDVLARLGRAP